MKERKGLVTMKGNPLTLVGEEVRVGQMAPDFTVTANDMSEVRFSSLRGKICIISSVPSLDTAVCDAETRRSRVRIRCAGRDRRRHWSHYQAELPGTPAIFSRALSARRRPLERSRRCDRLKQRLQTESLHLMLVHIAVAVIE